LAITILAEQKVCDTAGGDNCLIFGATVDTAYAAVSMAQPPILDKVVLIAISLIVLYAIVVVVQGIVSAARPVKSKQQAP
jgi:hypothetical protein